MNKAIKIHPINSVAKKIVATAMMLLLLWITGINFLYLTGNKSASLVTCTTTDEDDDCGSTCSTSPAGPDEKSPDAPISVTEEFIHEYHNPVNPLWVDMFFQHKIHETEKLCVVHTELLTPPPEV